MELPMAKDGCALSLTIQSPKCRRTINSGPVVAILVFTWFVWPENRVRLLPLLFYKGQAHIDMFNKWCLLSIVVINWLSHDNLQFVDKAPVSWTFLLPPRETTHLLLNILFHFAPHIAFKYISFKIDFFLWKMVYLLSNTSCVVYVVR